MYKFHIKTRQVKSLFFLASIIILVICVSIYKHQSSEINRKNLSDTLDGPGFTDKRKELYKLLKDRGPEVAVKIIKNTLLEKKISLSECHSLLHAVGHEAYEKGQDLASASKLIDDMCYTAYLHGVEAQIVFSRPEDYIKILNDLCGIVKKENPKLYCFHGAGHAFMQSSNNVEKSLSKCDELNSSLQGDVGNCYGGVFSEFGNRIVNFDTDTGEHISGPPLLNFTYEHPLQFCLTLSEKYQHDCARQLVKIKFQDEDMESNFAECTANGLSADMTGACVNVTSVFFAENHLYQNGDIPLPKEVLSLPEKLKKEYIWGARTSLLNWPPAKVSEISKLFCGRFGTPKDQKNCRDMMRI